MNQKACELITLLNQNSTDTIVFQLMSDIIEILNSLDTQTILSIYNAVDRYNFNNYKSQQINFELQNCINNFYVRVSNEYHKRIQFPTNLNNQTIIPNNQYYHDATIMKNDGNEKSPLIPQIEVYIPEDDINNNNINNNKKHSISATSTQYDKCIIKFQPCIVYTLFISAFVIGGIIFTCFMVLKN